MSAEKVGELSQNIIFPELWMFLSAYSEMAFIVFLLIIWLAWLIFRRTNLWQAATSVTAGLIITVPVNYILRALINRPRPFMSADFEPLIEHGGGAGLPSNHAAATAVFTACLLFGANKKTGIVVLLITVLVGAARVFSGLHYPGDIAAGWLVGGSIGVLAAYLQNKYVPEPPNILNKSNKKQT